MHGRGSLREILVGLVVVLTLVVGTAQLRGAGGPKPLTRADLLWLDRVTFGVNNRVVSSYQQLGREKFLEKVWEWKDKHGGIIIQQLKKLGCSCDWTRERFTMDEAYSRCVLETFVDLYQNDREMLEAKRVADEAK